MKKFYPLFFILGLFFLFIPLSNLEGVDTHNTQMLTHPAISQKNIVFSYSNDLWISDLQGKGIRRLTSHKGVESYPVFSPDGEWIAFSGEYDGNTDVYIIPSQGGIPKRLTWHPYPDTVRAFTPDGKYVVFMSSRFSFTGSRPKLYKVPVQGGIPVPEKIPYAHKASYSSDGQRIAYTPFREAFHQWKHYRGGTFSRIWIITLKDSSIEKIPQPEGRCNDTDPMWIGSKIYFRSDRNGEFNLFCFDTETKQIKQLTDYNEFPIIMASFDENKILFEQKATLHLFNVREETIEDLSTGVATDLLALRSRYEKGSRYIRNADISPTGARAVFEFRGEIITFPAEKGDFRNLTETPGINERSPVWSPDGKKIAYFSDENGEYSLHIQEPGIKGDKKKYPIKGAGFYDRPYWSPDSKKISYTDNSWSLYWFDLETGNSHKIAQEYLYGPSGMKTIHGVWSPDSKWIAYTLNTKAYIQKVYVYSTEEDKSYPITDGLSEVSDPVFDPSGKYLYFFASTDAGPVKHWFAMSSADMRMTNAIYLAVLQKEVPSPLAKESDEEKGIEEEKPENKEEGEEEEETKFLIDFEGLNERILNFPVPEGNYYSLQTGSSGQIFYLEAPPNSRGPYARETKLHKFDLDKRKDTVILTGVNGYKISAENKKLLYISGQDFGITDISDNIKPGQGKLNTESIEVQIDPPKEWKQIFHEAWRVNRDYFYDPSMHGVDWDKMREKYSVFLPHLSCRQDLNRVIQWMCSELGVGHHRVGGGDTLTETDRVPVGLLGADYEVRNNRYQFKKVYGGLNWNPELRSPLTQPGVNVVEGEYLMAVNGEPVKPPENLFKFFENTAGRLTEITVSSDPEGKNSRDVNVVPLSSEYSLRNRDWMESNIDKVNKATNGRVAYVYVPNTSTLGHTYFKRYFFPQSHKDAIIVDERFNGGGSVADYYIDILRRPYVCYWNMRYGADLKTPSASIQGPKVMLINESAGSGGDLLPWMFRKFSLGNLIGTRTWGGLVGTLGFPVLMDGGYVTAPNLAIWTEDGWIVENEGVPPDIKVQQTPSKVLTGQDPQLEKAIEVVLEELKKNPPEKPERPPYKKIK
ncbi:MAG: PDZ domain-containing protein [Candidatus Aminicenantes bacterium]